jgi:hypothetical protein
MGQQVQRNMPKGMMLASFVAPFFFVLNHQSPPLMMVAAT